MDAAAPDPEEDRCLCHPVGASQVQADASPDQRRKRLVRPAPPRQPNALRPLEVMSWQWLNIGSRVTRDGHARFWERPAVKFLRATRQSRHFRRVPNLSGLIRLSEVRSALRHFGIAPEAAVIARSHAHWERESRPWRSTAKPQCNGLLY